MEKLIWFSLAGAATLLLGLSGCVLALMTNKPQVFLSSAVCAALSLVPITHAQFAYQDWRNGPRKPFDWNWNIPIIAGAVLIALFVGLVIWSANHS